MTDADIEMRDLLMGAWLRLTEWILRDGLPVGELVDDLGALHARLEAEGEGVCDP